MGGDFKLFENRKKKKTQTSKKREGKTSNSRKKSRDHLAIPIVSREDRESYQQQEQEQQKAQRRQQQYARQQPEPQIRSQKRSQTQTQTLRQEVPQPAYEITGRVGSVGVTTVSGSEPYFAPGLDDPPPERATTISSALAAVHEANKKIQQNRRHALRHTRHGEELISDAKEMNDIEGLIIQLLATRSYCLPGNNWGQDLVQFFQNNHPVLGICFHYKIHPLRKKDRVVCLIASIAFGIAAVCSVVIWFDYHDEDMNEAAVRVTFWDDDDEIQDDDELRGFIISKGMVALFMFGTAFHSAFDLFVWYTTACFCCRKGGPCYSCGLDWVGSYISMLVSCIAVFLAMYAVCLRAVAVDEDANHDGLVDEGLRSFSFVVAYTMELFLTWFLFYPIMATVLFTGVLGCNRIPVIGGRPFEKKRMDNALRRIREKQQRKGIQPPVAVFMEDDGNAYEVAEVQLV